MKIAIIGSGIAGNVVAHRLHREHDVTVFEAAGHVGGHSHTHVVEQSGRRYDVDTGFIVFNDRTYPSFTALLARARRRLAGKQHELLGALTRPRGLEYNGTTLNTLFAQRRNLVRPSFLGMIRDILRFNREAPALLGEEAGELPLGEVLGARPLRPRVHRALHRADGRRDLVDRPRGDARVSRRGSSSASCTITGCSPWTTVPSGAR